MSVFTSHENMSLYVLAKHKIHVKSSCSFFLFLSDATVCIFTNISESEISTTDTIHFVSWSWVQVTFTLPVSLLNFQ